MWMLVIPCVWLGLGWIRPGGFDDVGGFLHYVAE